MFVMNCGRVDPAGANIAVDTTQTCDDSAGSMEQEIGHGHVRARVAGFATRLDQYCNRCEIGQIFRHRVRRSNLPSS